MKDLNTLLIEKFKDKDFEKKYHRISALYRLADEVLLLRKKRGLTQKELAEKIGTTQAVVSRLESASVKPSMETVLNFAEALDAVVDFRLTPMEDARWKSKELDQRISREIDYRRSLHPYFGLEYSEKVQSFNLFISDSKSNMYDLSTNYSTQNVESTKQKFEYVYEYA